MTCKHGFIGACAECDRSDQIPEPSEKQHALATPRDADDIITLDDEYGAGVDPWADGRITQHNRVKRASRW